MRLVKLLLFKLRYGGLINIFKINYLIYNRYPNFNKKSAIFLSRKYCDEKYNILKSKLRLDGVCERKEKWIIKYKENELSYFLVSVNKNTGECIQLSPYDTTQVITFLDSLRYKYQNYGLVNFLGINYVFYARNINYNKERAICLSRTICIKYFECPNEMLQLGDICESRKAWIIELIVRQDNWGDFGYGFFILIDKQNGRCIHIDPFQTTMKCYKILKEYNKYRDNIRQFCSIVNSKEDKDVFEASLLEKEQCEERKAKDYK
jgi:hypothetical protein